MRIRNCFCIIAALVSFSCRTTGQNHLASYETANIEAWRWPDPGNIPVCWEDPSPNQIIGRGNGRVVQPATGELEQFKTAVQSRAVQEYGKAGIAFTGWTTCTAQQPGIHILLNWHISQVRGFGRVLDGAYAGVNLIYPTANNHIFALTSAIHELGHAIGLRHEASRIDARKLCPDFYPGEQGEPNAFSLGSFDKESIMNYCTLFDNAKPSDDDPTAHLSPTDIAAIHEIYHGVVAELASPLPLIIGVESYASKLKSIDSYRFKYGLYDATSCQNPSGYVDTNGLDALTLTRGVNKDDEYRLCLLGQRGGHWQSLTVATEYFFHFVNTPVFADFSIPLNGMGVDVSTITFTANSANSTKNVGGIRIKSAPAISADGTALNCGDDSGYSGSQPPGHLSMTIPTDGKSHYLKICVVALDTLGNKQPTPTANILFFGSVASAARGILFVPGLDPAGAPMPTPVVYDDRSVVMLLSSISAAPPSALSYSFGPGKDCGSTWREIGPYDPIVVDQAQLDPKVERVTLCIKTRQESGEWQDLPKRTWSHAAG